MRGPSEFGRHEGDSEAFQFIDRLGCQSAETTHCAYRATLLLRQCDHRAQALHAIESDDDERHVAVLGKYAVDIDEAIVVETTQADGPQFSSDDVPEDDVLRCLPRQHGRWSELAEECRECGSARLHRDGIREVIETPYGERLQRLHGDPCRTIENGPVDPLVTDRVHSS